MGKGIGLYQSCMNRRSVGHMSVFGLRWCWWGSGCEGGRVLSMVLEGGVVLCMCVL